jgi:hypothetical protein
MAVHTGIFFPPPENSKTVAGFWWLTAVILAMWEAEIRRIVV